MSKLAPEGPDRNCDAQVLSGDWGCEVWALEVGRKGKTGPPAGEGMSGRGRGGGQVDGLWGGRARANASARG